MSQSRSRRIPVRSQRRRVPARSPSFERLEPRELLATLVVNSNGDFDLTTNPAETTLTLRQAIEVSNTPALLASLPAATQAQVVGSFVVGVPNTILFNLSGSGIETIRATSALPAITQPLAINGYSEAGSSVSPPSDTAVDINNATIQLDGSGLTGSTPVDGLDVETANCVIDGLIITGFSGAGVSISGTGSQGNWLWGDFFGALPDPANGKAFEDAAAGLGNGVAGVEITSSNNRIGGDTPGLPNVMANTGDTSNGTNPAGVGILITSAGGTGNLIQGNVVVDNAAQGLLISSSNNTIGEALSGGGNVISDNGGAGVEITGGLNVQGNQLLGNFIGTDLGNVAGSIPKGEIALPNLAQGVLIDDSPKNTIGGYAGAAENVIGPNQFDGVEIDGSASTGNRVLGNDIGFNVVDSTIALLPNQNGVSINLAGGNFIGAPNGTNSGGNTISNNRDDGILLNDSNPPAGFTPTPNVVAGNIIGLNPDGGSAFPNAFNGVAIDDAPDNVIGGTTQPFANTISANNNGVEITGSLATGNLIEGNLIGTGTDGLTSLGNAVDGVLIDGAPLNTVGGTAAGMGNVISGNNRGVVISGAGSTGNLVQGNEIGTNSTGSVIANQIDGVFVTVAASNNTIGGPLPGAGNVIAFNAGQGVYLDEGTGNAVLGNSIYSNNAPGGLFLNPYKHADNLEPAPVLTSVAPNGPSSTVQGTLTAAPSTTYTVQFFSNDVADPSGHGQGQTLALSTTLTTNASGFVSFALNLPGGIASGQWVTATATDPEGNTSTFSNSVIAVPVALQLGSASDSTNETSGSVAITVTRTGGQGGSVAVNFSVGGGTAVAAVDYTPVSGTLYFNPGDPATKTFNVPILDAQRVGGSVAVNVTLSNPANGATLGVPSTAVLTIQDTDQAAIGFPTPAAGATPYTFDGPGVAYFAVTRTSGAGTATIDYATGGGTAVPGVNYVPASGVLTFAPGQTTQSVAVTILDDEQVHAVPLTFGLSLSQPTGGVLGPISTVSATCVSYNTPGSLLLQSTTAAAAPGTSTVPITVVRTGGKAGTVTVAYATGGGTARPGIDYAPVSGTLTFAPGQTAEVVNVPILNPSTTGLDPTFIFGLGGPTGGATLAQPMNTTVTIYRAVAPGVAATTTNNAPPAVADVLPVAGAGGIVAVVITFNKPMNPTLAQNAANYSLTSGGYTVPIIKAGYDPSANHAVLFLGVSLPFGDFARLGISGLADTTGRLFDGSGTGVEPGSPYAVLIGEGQHLSYTDRSGNLVTLNLAGPGLLALSRGLDGEAQQLQILGAVSNLDTLTGSLIAGPGSTGTTSLPSISGASGVDILLSTPPFYVGGVTAMAVDRRSDTD